MRSAPDGSDLAWRVDDLAVEYFAAGATTWGGLPRRVEQSSDRGSLSSRTTQLTASCQTSEQSSSGHARAVFSALLLLPSECRLAHVKSDVTQQLLTLPLVLQQLHWFGRAAKLQAATGIAFADLNLLRRAFVHQTHSRQTDRPHARRWSVMARAGTLAAQEHTCLRDSLRSKGCRRLIARMEKEPLAKDELMTASVEYHNQRLEFLGDAVLQMVASHHVFCLFPDDDEGGLTEHRTAIINSRALAQFSLALGLHTFVLLGTHTPPGRSVARRSRSLREDGR